MPLSIDYESAGFPTGGPVANGFNSLSVTWDDLAWAAVTIGRPDWVHVFGHGDPSLFEAIFRWSMLRMALEQAGPAAYRLRRTGAARALDPTEKGAVNYFIGMVMCKVFAEKRLNAPWLLHLDVYGGTLAQVLTGRSRPDLIGQIAGTNDWLVLESKGRVSGPTTADRTKAKNQARRVTTVGGNVPRFAIGAITYLRNDVLQFDWEDPVPSDDVKKKFDVPPPGNNVWRFHYQSALAFYRAQKTPVGDLSEQVRLIDVVVDIHPEMLKPLLSGQWDVAKSVADRMGKQFVLDGFHLDGLKVAAGKSWLQPHKAGRSE